MFYLLITIIFSPIIYPIIIIRHLVSSFQTNRFLIIQTGKIGDMVYATSVISNLKQRLPHAWIAVLTSPVSQPLLINNPKVDKILLFYPKKHRGFLGKLRLASLIKKNKITCSITLLPNVSNSFITFWGLIPKRLAIYPNFIGITYRLFSIFNSKNIPHHPDTLLLKTYANLLEKIKGGNYLFHGEIFISSEGREKVKRLYLEHNLSDNMQLIGILPSSGNKMKQWPKERVIGLARLIEEKIPQAKLFFLGAKNDFPLITDIQDNLKFDIINTAGLFKLEELPALLEKMKVVIGVDSGPIYIADALNVPVIDICGPSNINEQRPLGKGAVVIQKTLPCVPCSHPFNAPYICKAGDNMSCVKTVEIEEVFKKLYYSKLDFSEVMQVSFVTSCLGTK
ncbi:MAG: glycosyltransferase family 9 protein [bacterium]